MNFLDTHHCRIKKQAFKGLPLIVVLAALAVTSCSQDRAEKVESTKKRTTYEFTDSGWALLDHKGKVTYLDRDIIPLSKVRENHFAYTTGKETSDTSSESGVIDLAGHRQIFDNWIVSEKTRFSDGLAPVHTRKYEGTYGVANGGRTEFYRKRAGFCYVDCAGRKAIVQDFYEAEPFSEGLAAVVTRQTAPVQTNVGYPDKENLFGYIDKTGKVILPPKYTSASEFHAGRAVVSFSHRGKDRALIDKTGKVIFSSEGWGIKPFSDDGYAVFWHLGNPGPPRNALIDRFGHITAEDVDYLNFSEGVGLISPSSVATSSPRSKEIGFEFANFKGENVLQLPRSLTGLTNTEKSYCSEGMIAVPVKYYPVQGWSYRGYLVDRDAPCYGFVDKNGKLFKCNLPANREITNVFPFSDGYALIRTATPRLLP